MKIEVSPEQRSAYASDGAICLRNVLDPKTLNLAQQCYEWSLDHPTASACRFYETTESTFYQDLCHPAAAHAYRELIEKSNIADTVAALWQAPDVWFLYEQVFLKEGKATRRTPWHQDSPYLAVDGSQVAVVWINFDPVTQGQSLEFVRGSHLQTLYNGSAFDPEDDTAPIFAEGLPRLPNIEADREQWDIVSWGVEPGDVVIFHPSTLHGGALTHDGVRRRTLSLRFFGEDAVYVDRPEPAPAPLVTGLHDTLNAGDLFRHPAFPKLRPIPSGFDAIPTKASEQEKTLGQQIRLAAIDT